MDTSPTGDPESPMAPHTRPSHHPTTARPGRLVGLALAAVLAIALPACTSDSSDGSGTTTTRSTDRTVEPGDGGGAPGEPGTPGADGSAGGGGGASGDGGEGSDGTTTETTAVETTTPPTDPDGSPARALSPVAAAQAYVDADVYRNDLAAACALTTGDARNALEARGTPCQDAPPATDTTGARSPSEDAGDRFGVTSETTDEAVVTVTSANGGQLLTVTQVDGRWLVSATAPA